MSNVVTLTGSLPHSTQVPGALSISMQKKFKQNGEGFSTYDFKGRNKIKD